MTLIPCESATSVTCKVKIQLQITYRVRLKHRLCDEISPVVTCFSVIQQFRNVENCDPS